MKWLVILCVCVVGCTDEPPPSISGNPGSGVGEGGGGSGGVPAVDGGTDAAVDGGESKGACDNEADLGVIEGADPSVRDVARDCGKGECAIFFGLGLEYESCVDRCVTDQVPDLSTGCTVCYGSSERCSHDSLCILRCRNDTCSTMCLDCMMLAGCIEELEECTGIPGNDCPDQLP